MNTTTPNNETGRENMMTNTNGTTLLLLAQTEISLGVARDSLLEEFERNAAEPDTAAIAPSIFTPSYGQSF
jgi:hypothetical protein